MSEVRCSHILAKHSGSRNPVSRRTGKTITLSKADAIKEIEALIVQLKANPGQFAAIAEQRSDCGSYAQGGDLGKFGRGAMQKPFEDASFALRVGEMSGVVDTDSGIHVILRTA